MSKKTNKTTSLSRRAVLKGAAGYAGAAAGSGAITGFPAVWAQEEKVLRYLGTAVNQSDDMTKKVKEETGITIQNIVATTDDVTKRVITQRTRSTFWTPNISALRSSCRRETSCRWTPTRSKNSTK